MSEQIPTQPTTPAYNPPALEEFKKIILDPERADARKRLANQDYWGDTGYWVVQAINEIDRAIDSVERTPKTNFGRWIKKVISETEWAHMRFRQKQEDPDGYGSATFNEVLGRMNGIRECHLENMREAKGESLIVRFLKGLFGWRLK
jgi:hypothetical protein